MSSPESRWKFSVAVMLPVVGAVIVTILLAAGFVAWASAKSDQRALDRQSELAARVFATAKSDFTRSQREQVLRYDAIDVFMATPPDRGAIDDYFGVDEFEVYGHDMVVVLDPAAKPVYAARDGQEVDTGVFAELATQTAPLIEKLRGSDAQARIRAYERGDADAPAQAMDLVQVDGKPAMLAVLPIVSNWEGQEQPTYFMHAVLRFLDEHLAKELNDEFMIDGLRFGTTPDTGTDETMIPLANAAGRFVAYLKWSPDVPGRDLVKDSLPAIIGLLVVITIVISLLLVGLSRSMRALDKARAEALHRATHDHLTGLANRALFTEQLERSPLPLTLLALDLDRFKAVNDTLGHEAGDDLLKQVAARLLPLVKPPGLVARIGGDEFMILLSGHVGEASVAELARNIVEALSHPFRLAADTVQIGVSVGIARADTDERKELVAKADFALYDAKESGRNTYRMFDAHKRAA